jgi:hypothetical protein
MFSDPFGICENLGNPFWDGDLVDTEVGICGNHCATRKVDTLPRKVSSESALLPFEPLAKTSHRFLPHLGGDTWQFGIDIHRDRHLEEFPLFLEKLVRRPKGEEIREIP